MNPNVLFYVSIFLCLLVSILQKQSCMQDKESQMSLSWMRGFFLGGAAMYAVMALLY